MPKYSNIHFLFKKQGYRGLSRMKTLIKAP